MRREKLRFWFWREFGVTVKFTKVTREQRPGVNVAVGCHEQNKALRKVNFLVTDSGQDAATSF
jgi:hypothetical protein